MIFFAIVLVVLAILVCVIGCLLILKLNSEFIKKTKQSVEDILESRQFEVDSIFVISKRTTIALNKQHNKIAIIQDFNPDIPDIYNYSEVKSSALVNIENNGFIMKINFRVQGVISSLSIPSFSKEGSIFWHELLRKILFKRLEAKYPDFDFKLCAASDWQCSYIWAYDPLRCAFAYCMTGEKPLFHIMNLRREFFTIDTDYKYLELPIMGEPRQLLIYEKDFLFDLYSCIFQTIKMHITPAVEDKIFYDSYSNIIYLSNGLSSMQSIILEKIEEVFYRDNRISFTLLDDKKIISFMADRDYINQFEKFVVGYNLRKIANSFDYTSDKLINVNTNTKFIIDITRDRVVYCANLNKFIGFSYMTISFSNLKSAEVKKSALKYYVRITTYDDEILDVTCLKPEVAEYIKAQIELIISCN